MDLLNLWSSIYNGWVSLVKLLKGAARNNALAKMYQAKNKLRLLTLRGM